MKVEQSLKLSAYKSIIYQFYKCQQNCNLSLNRQRLNSTIGNIILIFQYKSKAKLEII